MLKLSKYNTEGTSWGTDINRAVSIDSKNYFQNAVVYNYGLKRYITTSYIGNSWDKPETESTIMGIILDGFRFITWGGSSRRI